jgi:sugar-specific transcriptional regulator TrmB
VVVNTELLEKIGLTKSEAKVYLALLELGSTTKGPIVSASGVSSSKIYELLDKLADKGLVSSVVTAGVKHFEAAPPSRILDYLQQKEKEIKLMESRVEKVLPELELRRALSGPGSETQVFKGMKGAETSFEDILKELKPGEEYYVLGISKITPSFEKFVVDFHKKRAKKKIKCKIIVNELARKTGLKLDVIPLTKVRYLREELFTPVVFIVYGQKTLISLGLDLIFIQIKSRNLSAGLKAYANYMFKIGKKK